MSKEGASAVNLQYGNPHGANQSGMSFGGRRDIGGVSPQDNYYNQGYGQDQNNYYGQDPNNYYGQDPNSYYGQNPNYYDGQDQSGNYYGQEATY